MPAPHSFLKHLREWCDAHGALLIADEVQSGAGRTGAFYACDAAGVQPDILTTAKGIASGYPLSAVIAKATRSRAPRPSRRSTYLKKKVC